MKIFLLLTSIVITNQFGFAQNVTNYRNLERMKNAELNSVSGGNPWIVGSGSQVGYMFGGSEEFADALLVSANVLYDKDFKEEGSKFHFPIMGNISQITSAVSNPDSINQLKNTARDLMFSN